jgi:hypothetical protein
VGEGGQCYDRVGDCLQASARPWFFLQIFAKLIEKGTKIWNNDLSLTDFGKW